MYNNYDTKLLKKKRTHPIFMLFNRSNILVCTSLIQTGILLYIVILMMIWYHDHKPAIDAITKFPWENASKDAVSFYNSVKTYEARKTLDTTTDTIETLNLMVHNQDDPLKKISEIVNEAHKDKDVFEHMKNVVFRLYKPIETMEDGQEDIMGLIHNFKTQTDDMNPNEIHELIKKIMMFIEKINKVLTPDNINNFFDTTKTLNTKLKSTDVKEINKLVKDTDDTVVKIERVGDILNNFKTP